MASNYQESSKNIANGSEQELRSLQSRIKQLERAAADQQREAELYEMQIKDKDDIISELRNKIYVLDRENQELQQQLTNLESKLAKMREEHQCEIEELSDKISEMKAENKTLKMPTMKDIKDGNDPDLRKKVESLEKQLEKKEELLRKMTDLRRETEADRTNEHAQLKKEIASLKETLEKAEGQKGGDNLAIEYKIQMERMKKELESCKKNEKALLIEKSKLEAGSRGLQDDIVRNKLAIANILNAVQETGNEKLISEVYSLTE